MPDKAKSISQARLMGMAWAARTGRLDTSKLSGDFKDKIEGIAKSKNFSDDTLHKMAKTKYKDEGTNKLKPYKIGKGTTENPDKKRRPYKKKKEVVESFSIKSYNIFLLEKQFKEFYSGYLHALYIMEDLDIPEQDNIFESFKIIMENIQLNPGMNVPGMGPVELPGNPGTTTDFHNQEIGSGDVPVPFETEDNEDDEECDEDDEECIKNKKDSK